MPTLAVGIPTGFAASGLITHYSSLITEEKNSYDSYQQTRAMCEGIKEVIAK
jgi:hypothetical protein